MITLKALILAAAMLAAPAAAQAPEPEMTTQEIYDAIYFDEQNATTDEELRELAEEYEQLAAEGHTPSMVRLGRIAHELKDEAGATAWTQKAADAGDPAGQYYLSVAHYRHKRCDEAFDWMKRSAAQGHAQAVVTLGTYYEAGKCGEKDHVQSVFWFEKAARLGMGVAQCKLAGKYADGHGVKKDPVKAYAWYLLASQQTPEPLTYVVWNPQDSWQWAVSIGGKLPDARFAEGWRLAQKLCGEDKVCSRVPEDRIRTLMQPPKRGG